MSSSSLERLQEALATAKKSSNIRLEIEILIELGDFFLATDDLESATFHYRLAITIIQNDNICTQILDEVLGRQAYIQRRLKNYSKSLNLYFQATTAAQKSGKIFEYAKWLGKQGIILRLMKNYQKAQEMLVKSREIFLSFGDAGRLAAAEQDGNLGLLASDKGDIKKAEEQYRKALDVFIKDCSDDNMLITWKANLANILSRDGRFQEAWQLYEEAMMASISMKDQRLIYDLASKWSNSYARAHQRSKAADVLLDSANHLTNIYLKCSLIEKAFLNLHSARDWARMLRAGQVLIPMLIAIGSAEDTLEKYQALLESAHKNMRKSGEIT